MQQLLPPRNREWRPKDWQGHEPPTSTELLLWAKLSWLGGRLLVWGGAREFCRGIENSLPLTALISTHNALSESLAHILHARATKFHIYSKVLCICVCMYTHVHTHTLFLSSPLWTLTSSRHIRKYRHMRGGHCPRCCVGEDHGGWGDYISSEKGAFWHMTIKVKLIQALCQDSWGSGARPAVAPCRHLFFCL